MRPIVLTLRSTQAYSGGIKAGLNVILTTQDGEEFRCRGGGYDMAGTVFGDWLQTNYQARIEGLVRAGIELIGLVPGGLTPGQFYLDGGTGLECMERVAEAIDLQVTRFRVRDKLAGFVVIDTKEIQIC